jgi:hypothetical protein
MADIEDNLLLKAMIRDPGWCLFFHRNQVKRLLPAMAKNHILVINLEKRLKDDVEKLDMGKLMEDEKGIT